MFVNRLNFQFQFSGGLFTFTEEILNWKFYFLCSAKVLFGSVITVLYARFCTGCGQYDHYHRNSCWSFQASRLLEIITSSVKDDNMIS